MSNFVLTTTWSIPAPLDQVWSVLIDTESWPDWWLYVESVRETSAGLPSGVGNIRHYRWRTSLPYSLHLNLEVSSLKPLRSATVAVTGDLEGEGRSRLIFFPQTGQTQVTFNWCVRTTKPWMNWLGRLGNPIFRWNHARVMQRGEQGLIQYLNQKR